MDERDFEGEVYKGTEGFWRDSYKGVGSRK